VKLHLRFFASLREALGPGETIEWTATEAPTAGALRQWLRERSPAHALALAPDRAVRVAVDQTMAGDATPLHDGEEVAFFPPVTGG